MSVVLSSVHDNDIGEGSHSNPTLMHRGPQGVDVEIVVWL